MTDTKENIMGTLPIGKLLMKMSVPVILSMLVSTLYGVIDSIFVSRLGDNALTAMSLATPISSLIACITVGFSVGMNAELSKKLGEGDLDGANKAAGNGILVNWLVSGIFLIFGLFFVPMFYRLQTDNATIQRIGTDYTSIICIFSFGVANQVKIGTVNTVWFAFVITEVLVAMLAVILMKAVNSKTISRIPFNIVKPDLAAEM